MLKPDSRVGALSTFLMQLEGLGIAGNRLHYFRGHSKKTSYQLEPSIFRNPGWIVNEATMLKELILRCPNDFTGGLSTFQCLVKMQHYGLPTRLLDVTSNPLVALYFACESHEKDDEDGEVIVFDYGVKEVKYFDDDTVSVIANLSRRPSGFNLPALLDGVPSDSEEAIDQFNKEKSIKLLLHDIRNDKPHFSPKIIRADLERVVCVKPLLDNPRIIRQEGAFLLFGCKRIKDQPAKLDSAATVRKLTIIREKKRELRGELLKIGISRATLFPEIEHVAEHIKSSHWVVLRKTVDVAKLGPVQASAFEALRDVGKGSVQDVANLASISEMSASRALQNLKRKGVVEQTGRGRSTVWKLV